MNLIFKNTEYTIKLTGLNTQLTKNMAKHVNLYIKFYRATLNVAKEFNPAASTAPGPSLNVNVQAFSP